MADLRTLTAEELAEAAARTYTIHELRLGMRVETTSGVGTIVALSIEHPPHEEIWVRFKEGGKPVGPYRPGNIHVLATPEENAS
jgi:hypothetical protein